MTTACVIVSTPPPPPCPNYRPAAPGPLQAKDLVYNMLMVDVEKRATMESILKHPVRFINVRRNLSLEGKQVSEARATIIKEKNAEKLLGRALYMKRRLPSLGLEHQASRPASKYGALLSVVTSWYVAVLL